ncbi:MAG TPA: DUF2064 domain-containing protein [Syntrophomonadaceae bacterium]|nr:DUF2064 domain-containing protein [Syntrophomonadaceae bacterium]
MKHAIILFTKVPETGKVKTRLTEERGGILTPEEAKNFYEACLLDTLDVCMSIKKARVWICYNQDGNRDVLNELIVRLKYANQIAGIFPDEGGSFDECMQYAADFVLKSGQKKKLAESILIVGGDTLGVQPDILIGAFKKLENLSRNNVGKQADILNGNSSMHIGAAMVVSPDQEGGFNVIGYTCNTPFDFRTIFYNQYGVTALEALAEKARQKRIPILPLNAAFDVDLPVDLASMIPILNVMEQGGEYDEKLMVPERTIAFLRSLGLQSIAEPIVGWS